MAHASVKQTTNCRFCHADPSKQSVFGEYVYGGSEDQHFYKCADCQMVYLYPPLDEAEEEKLYSNEFEKYMAKRAGKDMDWSGPEKHFQSNQREVSRRMPFIEPHLKGVKSVLEIGCSSGFMLSALKDRGLSAYGIDPSGTFTDYVRNKGIKVFKDFEEIKRSHPPLKFDLIIHYFVLEHVRTPVEFVVQYMDLLTPTGKMIFEVPCVSDPLVALYKIPAFDKFYWSVVHHWYFGKESLSAVLDKTGYEFTLQPEQRYDISNHMTWMMDGKPGGLGKYSHVFGAELDKLYKEQLKKNWICDTIVATVSKLKKG